MRKYHNNKMLDYIYVFFAIDGRHSIKIDLINFSVQFLVKHILQKYCIWSHNRNNTDFNALSLQTDHYDR